MERTVTGFRNAYTDTELVFVSGWEFPLPKRVFPKIECNLEMFTIYSKMPPHLSKITKVKVSKILSVLIKA